MNFTFITNNNRIVNTENLYFEPLPEIKKDKNGNQTIIFRLKTTGEGYLDFVYTIPPKDYMIGFGIKAYHMNNVLPASINSLEMQWISKIRQQEKGRQFESRYSMI